MKPDKLIFDNPEKGEISIQVPAKTEKKVHSIKPYKGHSLFSFNLITGECTKVDIKKVNVDINGGVHQQVKADNNCAYVSALNEKNAIKKFLQQYKKILTQPR